MSKAIDLHTTIGSCELDNPVLTASGTSGHGAELGAYFNLASLGAIVVKSLAAYAWAGNPAPRVAPLRVGMLNSVGLQGPGVEAFVEDELPLLLASGARVVVSIWGRRVEEFAQAAALLRGLSAAVIAVEVNVSCPNVEDRSKMFAHSPSATAEAVDAAGTSGLPRWAKLSPNVADVTEIAAAAYGAGAEAVVLTNTLLGLAFDVEARRPTLGAGGGGLSGAALHPVAIRAVYECARAFPDQAIIGVGGVSRAEHAVEFLLAGARAIEVGTATLADPRAPLRVLEGLVKWCRDHDVASVSELIGATRA